MAPEKMRNRKLLNLGLLFFVFLGVFIFVKLVFAYQGFPSFARNFQVVGKARVGDIVSKTKNGVVSSHVPYSKEMIGVVVSREKPVFVFGKPSTSTVTVASFGKAMIRVSNIGGKIKQGDFITSSNKPGVGQKANRPGYVIGRSLEDFNGEEGFVMAEINVQYINNQNNIDNGASIKKVVNAMEKQLSMPENFPNVLRYGFAFISGAGSLLLGFFLLGGVLRTGIEAMGRNPLAKNSIIITVVLNLIGVALVMAVGFGLALLAIFFK